MHKINQNHSRRIFLTRLSTAGIALALNPISSWAVEEQDPKIKNIVTRIMGIDAHNHMDLPFNKAEFKGQKYELAGELKNSGFTAIAMTFCVDRPALTKEGEAWERFITTLDEMDEILKENGLTRVLKAADLKEAYSKNKQIVIQSVEGGHFIEGRLERIEIAYKRGLRHIGLMHDGQSSPPMGDIYTDPPKYGGLTEFGVNTIKESNRLGILIDLAHCSTDAVNKAIEISTRPMIISHTGLNTQLGGDEQMAKMMMPRLISKEQAKIFAAVGGVIGVWTHLANSPLDYARNIRALVDIVGTEHVSMGTDTKMAPPSNAPDRFGKKTNLSWDNEKQGFFYVVVDALLKTGFAEKEIEQIGGGNYSRIFAKAMSS